MPQGDARNAIQPDHTKTTHRLNSIRRSVSPRYAIIFLSLTCGNAARYERAILVIVQYERAILAIVQKDCGRLAVSLHALSPGGRNFLLCNVE